MFEYIKGNDSVEQSLKGDRGAIPNLYVGSGKPFSGFLCPEIAYVNPIALPSRVERGKKKAKSASHLQQSRPLNPLNNRFDKVSIKQ